MLPNKARHNERGNVFIFILMGVVLFAALSFTVARGMRGDTANSMSDKQANLAASEILGEAQKVERSVNRIRNKGVSENDISFENSADYINTACDTGADPSFPRCQIYNPQGGGLSYKSPATKTTSNEWHFTGATCIADIGTGTTGCNSDNDTSNEELLMVLTDINETVCTQINKRLNISGIPADSGGGASTTKFTGTFANNTEIILAGGPYPTACYSRAGQNDFYHVLIAR